MKFIFFAHLSLFQLFTQRRIAEPGRGQGKDSQERKEGNLQIFLARQKKQGPVLCCGAGAGIRLLLDHRFVLFVPGAVV